MSLLDRLQHEGWLRNVDHALALTLRRLRPDTPDLVLAAAALTSRALAFGHSALRLDALDLLCAEIAPERETPMLPALEQWREALSASPWVEVPAGGSHRPGGGAAAIEAPPTDHTSTAPPPLVLEDERLALRRYWRYETQLAAALRDRSQRPAPHLPLPETARLRAMFPALDEDAEDAQAHAALALLRSSLVLLTGGPGTGKTTTVARALRLLSEASRDAGLAPLRIALAAPTGKAAARLGEALRDVAGSETSAGTTPPRTLTLHRLLGWRPDGSGFRHDAGHPLPFDVVVVDEASMVDLPLMTRLVDAVAPKSRLLLVGDRDQLPSVETGDVLAALCDAADAGGALAAQRFALTRAWRQDAATDLAALADAVRDGDSGRAIAGLAAQSWRGVQWLPARETTPGGELLSPAVQAFAALAVASDPITALRLARCHRLLTARREGVCGSVALNARVMQALQPPGASASALFHGALVIVGVNSPRHGLYNGDTGIAWRDDDGRLRVWFETDIGPRAWLPAALPPFEPAYALTVHKAQGSEFDEVLLVLPPATGGGVSRALSRELLYTGVTRCRRRLTLWADRAALQAAIERRAQRWSGLAARLGAERQR